MSKGEIAQPKTKAGGSPWGKVFWMFVILIVSGMAVFFSFVWLGKQTIDAGANTIDKIVETFKPTVVIDAFVEWRELEAKGTNGNILEVARATATEKFTRQTNLEMFGTTLPLGTTVSEIHVPATYRYHIDLLGEWFLTSDGNRLLVVAPALKPNLPVAFDTGKMQKKTTAGWARWDATQNLDELEKTLTAQLGERAGSERTLKKVRKEARVAVAKFLQVWLLSQDEWAEGRFEEISVIFEGEKGESLSSRAPSLKWQNPVGGKETSVVLPQEIKP